MSLLKGLLWGFLRRWFGGGFDEKYKWLRQGIANGGDGCRDFCGFVRPDNLVGCLTAGSVDSVSVLEPGGGRDFGLWPQSVSECGEL